MRKRPTEEQIAMAAEWLRCNEGDQGGEAEACHAVAAWIEELCDKHQFRKNVRRLSREHGVRPEAVRAVLRKL